MSDNEKIIMIEEDCPTCFYLEAYMDENPQPGLDYFKFKEGDPRSEKMMKLIEQHLSVDEFPYCVEIAKGEEGQPIQQCNVDPLLEDLQQWYDQLDPRNKMPDGGDLETHELDID